MSQATSGNNIGIRKERWARRKALDQKARYDAHIMQHAAFFTLFAA
jgi:hypothetical protein